MIFKYVSFGIFENQTCDLKGGGQRIMIVKYPSRDRVKELFCYLKITKTANFFVNFQKGEYKFLLGKKNEYSSLYVIDF